MSKLINRLMPKRIATKIYLSIVLSGGLLIVILGIILSYTLKTKFLADFNYIQESQVRQFINTFDIHLKNINATVRNVSEYADVKKLLPGKYTYYESFEIFRNIYKYLNNIKAFDNWKDIYIFPAGRYTLLSTNIRHISSDYRKYGIDLDSFYAENRDINYVDGININGSNPGIGIALRVRDIQKMQVVGDIAVFMNDSILYDTLRDTNWSDYDLMVITNNKGEVVFSSNKNNLEKLGEEKVILAVYGDEIDIVGKNGNMYSAFLARSKVSEFQVISFADKTHIYEELNKLQLIIAAIVAACMVILLLAGRKAISFFTRPMETLTRMMRDAEKNNYNKPLNIEINNETRELVQSFNKMMLDIRENQILKKQAQIDALQKQINPHFLFNTLESIKVLAYTQDYGRISEMIRRLGDIFRYNMNRENKKTTTVEDELEHVENYLGVQQVRFSDKLAVEYKIDPEILDKETLKFVLQPIVENAVVHGLEYAVDNFVISLHAFKYKDDIIFKISDNGMGINEEKLAEINAMLSDPSRTGSDMGIGLKNISERLQLYYGRQYKLEIESIHNRGTTVIVKIPCRMEEEDV